MDYLKASILISTACSAVMTGAAVFAAVQSKKLNQSIDAGMAQIEAWNQYKSTTQIAR
jgi:hypothetical protein